MLPFYNVSVRALTLTTVNYGGNVLLVQIHYNQIHCPTPPRMKPNSLLLPIRRTFHSARTLHNETIMNTLNILADSKQPTNNIEKITKQGIVFSNGILVPSTHSTLLLSNKILQFQPKLELKGHIIDLDLNFLKLINPQPDLYVVGLGSKSRLLSEKNLELFRDLGVRLEITDTKNAARNFDLLATERPNQVGAILLPIGL